MKIIVWLTDSTWPASVDAAADYPDAQVVLMHVIDPDDVEAAEAARAGLLGRGIPATATYAHRTMVEAQVALLDAAEARLERPAQRIALTGRVEREVVTACADADLLVLARDGDHARLGPRSLGRATRFVLDHAPCRVLLVWPDEPPSLATLPAPPPDGGPPHGGPPHGGPPDGGPPDGGPPDGGPPDGGQPEGGPPDGGPPDGGPPEGGRPGPHRRPPPGPPHARRSG